MSGFDLTGRVAVITGGYRGIGLGMARALREAGAQVVFWARDEQRMADAAAALDATPIRCDVTDAEAVAAATAATLDAHGRIDVMIANAGRPPEFEWLPRSDPAAWSASLDVNLTGAFLVCRAAAEHMVERGGGGKIVIVSSVRAGFGTGHGPAYSAGKAGAEGMARSMAVALAPDDIQVNVIRAGWVETEMTDAVRTPEFEAALMAAVPSQRWGAPEDFGGLAVYLASDLSRFHTGDCITLDGGASVADPLAPPRGKGWQ